MEAHPPPSENKKQKKKRSTNWLLLLFFHHQKSSSVLSLASVLPDPTKAGGANVKRVGFPISPACQPRRWYWRTPRGSLSSPFPQRGWVKKSRAFPERCALILPFLAGLLQSLWTPPSPPATMQWDESQLWWAPFAMSKCEMRVCVGVLHHIYPHYNRRNDIRCGCFKFSYPGAPPHSSAQQRGFFRSVD